MNDGDVRLFDPNDPECPPNTVVNDFMWIDKGNWNKAIEGWRERSGYTDGLWADIKYPWWSYTGFQERKERWRALANENKSKYNAPWYTNTFWKEWKYKLAENIDNNYYDPQKAAKA